MRTLKQLLKTIFKYRLSSGLTILSLLVAFLGIIILSLYVNYERSFDKFHKNGDDTYLFSYNFDMGAGLPIPMGQLIKDEVPEIDKFTVFVHWWYWNALYKPEQTLKDGINAKIGNVSDNFFTVFDFPLLTGEPDKVLAKPGTIVISETLAKKIFGTIDVVGKSIMAGTDEPFTITGVMKDMPKNTVLRKDAVTSYISDKAQEDWSEWSYSLFFKLKKDVDKEKVIEKIGNIERIQQTQKGIAKRFSEEASHIVLIPIHDVHYKSNTYMFSLVNPKVLDILTLLIVILLIMGAVNFINFSTSQAPLRAKSLSVQQILGERKVNARLQIIGEAILLALFALGIALFIHHFAYQKIEDLFRIDGLSLDNRPLFYMIFIGFAVLFGLIAGAYPARYITSAPVSQAVKGKMFFSGKGKRFCNVLVTIQFVFTIALIASALTIEKQLNFWNNFDIGIDKENVLYLHTTPVLRESYQAFSDELMKNPEITNYTYAQFLPGNVGMGWGREIDGQQVQLKAWPVDERFIDFFDIKITQGRKFNQGESDINNFILNEKAVQQFGWDKPLEKSLDGLGGKGNFIGVSKNFNFSSLKGEIRPMLFWCTNTRKNVVMLKTSTTNYTQLRDFIASTAKKFDPENTFEAKFLDDSLEQLYSKETRMANFIEFVALWTILLALTGLLGLIIFMSRDRVKEIGIRKVNGATIWEIVRLLNKGVLIWLTIAFIIATPIAYYAMNKWLENFAYKTTLSWWIFALAGLSALLIALLTVSWQSYRAASRNPVEALRYE